MKSSMNRADDITMRRLTQSLVIESSNSRMGKWPPII